MSSSPNDPNPYAPPTETGVVGTGLTPELSKIITDFRSQSLALGVLWLLNAGWAVFVGYSVLQLEVPQGAADPRPTTAAIFFGFAAIWTITGVGTLAKQPWAVYVGLGMTYLSIIFNLLNFGAGTIVVMIILVVILLQAHRVIGFMSKIRAAGLPLTTPS